MKPNDELTHTLMHAKEEIASLRQANMILLAQMRVVDIFAAALEYQPRPQGASVDVAWKLQKLIDELTPQPTTEI